MPKISDQRKSQKRQHIINAALTCFADQGVDGTSMRDICRRSDVSRGAIYVYFENKADLIHAVFEQLHQQSLALFESALSVDDDKDGPLDQIFDGAFAFFREPQIMMMLTLDAELKSYALRNPLLLERMRENGKTIVSLMAKITRRLQARGALDPALDPNLVACALLAIHDGSKQTMSVFAASEFDLDRYLKTIRALLRIDG